MLYHAIENTMASTSDATCARRMMGRLGVMSNRQWLSCVLIGCIFNGVVSSHIPNGSDASAMDIHSIITFDRLLIILIAQTLTGNIFLGDRKKKENGKDTTSTLTMLVTPC